MKTRIAALATLCFGLVVWAVPASAGGWASVHVDSIPAEIFVDEPVTFGFRVLQHDVTPIDIVDVFFQAVNRETRDELKVEAVQEGEVGHYTVEVNFPSAGSWKSIITPGGFQGTALPTLNVRPAGAAGLYPNTFPEPVSRPAAIHAGACDNLADPAHELADTGDSPHENEAAASQKAWAGAETAKVVAVSESMVPVALSELLQTPNAIVIHKSDDPNAGVVACGDIGGATTGNSLIVGLDEIDDSGAVGIAMLESEGDETKVQIYTFDTGARPVTASSEPSGEVVEVNILALPGGEWTFEPSSVTIPAGATIKWTNATEIDHTIQSSDINFEDSGLLPTGESFTETFDQPGTYFYTCGPHPWMSGTITVE